VGEISTPETAILIDAVRTFGEGTWTTAVMTFFALLTLARGR